MGNKKKAVSFSRQCFESALERTGLSKNKLAKKAFPDVADPARKLHKYLEAGEMAPDVLDTIATELGVSTDYLSGTYSDTTTILTERIVAYKTDGRIVRAYDQEELIRCKDCKWFRTFYHGETMPFSYECAKLWLTGIGVDDFCSKAERREE